MIAVKTAITKYTCKTVIPHYNTIKAKITVNSYLRTQLLKQLLHNNKILLSSHSRRTSHTQQASPVIHCLRLVYRPNMEGQY